jgi:hypothetical protein
MVDLNPPLRRRFCPRIFYDALGRADVIEHFVKQVAHFGQQVQLCRALAVLFSKAPAVAGSAFSASTSRRRACGAVLAAQVRVPQNSGRAVSMDIRGKPLHIELQANHVT